MCSMRLNFFMCKVEEMLPHESLGCVNSMRHQVILVLLRIASGSPVTPATAVICTSSRKTLLSVSVMVLSVSFLFLL